MLRKLLLPIVQNVLKDVLNTIVKDILDNRIKCLQYLYGQSSGIDKTEIKFKIEILTELSNLSISAMER